MFGAVRVEQSIQGVQIINYLRLTHTQCRPEEFFGQSVCRQCCSSDWCNRGTPPGMAADWFNPTAKYTSRPDWMMERP